MTRVLLLEGRCLSVDSLGFLFEGNTHSCKIHVDYPSRLERHDPISLLHNLLFPKCIRKGQRKFDCYGAGSVHNIVVETYCKFDLCEEAVTTNHDWLIFGAVIRLTHLFNQRFEWCVQTGAARKREAWSNGDGCLAKG